MHAKVVLVHEVCGMEGFIDDMVRMASFFIMY